METAANKDWNMVSEIELVYKSKIKVSQRPQLTSTRLAYKLLMANWDTSRIELMEQSKAIFLNRSNRVLGLYELSTGGTTGTVIDPRILFAAALKINANSIILAHNHPSGTLQPSDHDKTITQKLKTGGTLLDIRLLDHLIITAEGYFSFADEGLL